jgi:protein-tyrosine phosphatase
MRRILLGAAPAMFWLAITHAVAQQTISTPILASDENFRDLAGIATRYGGTGFADTTAHGGVMRTGVFYRSEELNVSDADLATLSALHITRDIDLRTPAEIAATPDRVPSGASYINVNIYGTPSPPQSGTPTSPAQATVQFEAAYRAFVTDPVERTGFGTVLIDLAHADTPALWHCSAGKDRTGWTSALLQSIAGVAPETIMGDYLATNRYEAGQIIAELAAIRATSGDAAAAILAPTLGVQPSFLKAALDELTASYGSIDAYLTEGLGLSQADIFVLRAMMVDYPTLPGQSGFAGNAASGAALLNELQDSPLSGAYTAFNYYLQSAIDAGTLGGMETRVGGQVRADAAAYLLREPLWLDAALTPYADGRDLAVGETHIWLSGLGGYFATDGHGGTASSSEQSAGPLMGATWRIDTQASVFLGIGYDRGSVSSAGATADVGTALGTVGGRYAFGALEEGPYVAARTDVGGLDYTGKRPLGGGLGTARGSAPGAVYGAQAVLGDVIRLAPLTVTPQAGVRVAHVTLGGFQESGSELALNVDRLSHTGSGLLAGVEVGLDPQVLGAWTVTPTATLGAELALGNPFVAASGRLYGFTVNQYAAYDSRYLLEGGLGVTARHGAFAVSARVNAVHGDGSTGVSGQLALAYRFRREAGRPGANSRAGRGDRRRRRAIHSAQRAAIRPFHLQFVAATHLRACAVRISLPQTGFGTPAARSHRFGHAACCAPIRAGARSSGAFQILLIQVKATYSCM